MLGLYLPLGLKFGSFDYFIGLLDNAGMLVVYAGPTLVTFSPMEWHMWG